MSVYQGNVTQAQRDPQGFPDFLFQNCMSMAGDNNSTVNLVYVGFAKPGALEASAVWQIRKLTYDLNGNVIRVQWPTDGTTVEPTNQFRYIWNNRATLTYS